jgi:pSer/pThr/pTyr-binding forkhead associated (FHA) protein
VAYSDRLFTRQGLGLIVATFSLQNNASAPPRLEFIQRGTNDLHRVTIEHTPFKIGRCETSDLRIDSAQVSREHAQIYQRGGIWSVRDLGSTNGTQVNGKTVQESFLADGDILAIAETEVTFVASSVTPFQRMATQPIQGRIAKKLPALLPAEISQIRALNEAVLWQAISLQLTEVVSLETGRTEACFVGSTRTVQPSSESLRSHTTSRHFRELTRRLSIELAQSNYRGNRIFVPADIADFESPKDFFDHLGQLQDELALGGDVGVSISLPEIEDTGALDAACHEVRNAKTMLGLVNFQGSSSQVLELAACAPNYLVLCNKLLTGPVTSTPAVRRLELVLTTCRQLGIKAVLPYSEDEATVSQCQKLGYEFALRMTPLNEKVDRQDLACLAN